MSRRPLILASRSPQRRAILDQLGVSFEVRIAEIQELDTGQPREVVVENAYRKAAAVAQTAPDRLVLGVDTVVALGSRIYGKPADEGAARRTLTALAGTRHAVLGGVCLIDAGQVRTALATTIVEFRELDAAMIEWYLACGEWRHRAGGYAIQSRGGALIAAVQGEYLNVVGLPVATLLGLAPTLLWG